jgi:hypothetical protein
LSSVSVCTVRNANKFYYPDTLHMKLSLAMLTASRVCYTLQSDKPYWQIYLSPHRNRPAPTRVYCTRGKNRPLLSEFDGHINTWWAQFRVCGTYDNHYAIKA